MKNQKLKIGIFSAVIAVFFYLLGSFIGWPIQNDKLSGDIGKAKKASSTVVKIDRDALQEKMLSDTAYCQKTLATVGMMQLHAKQFGALLVLTDAVAKDEKTLQSSLEEMQKVKETVKNATAAIDIFADDMVRLSKGEKVNGFEQDYNNAMLGFSMLQRCSNVAVDFAQNVRDSLSLLAEANKKDIETMYAEWVTFAYADALMSQDELRCRNIEQLFFCDICNEDLFGYGFSFIRNSEDQLGLEIAFFTNNEQLQAAGLQNTEQLKAVFLAGEELNFYMIETFASNPKNSENNLGVTYFENENSLGYNFKFANSAELPCIEMLDKFIQQANQENLQLFKLKDKDVLGIAYGLQVYGFSTLQ